MTLSQFEKLKKFKTASFALWNDSPKKFQDIECIKKNIKNLHARVIILGLNPSSRVKINFLENFHKLGRGSRDRWYVKAFKNEPFCGVYMTDLIYHAETKASKIILRWRGENFRKDNIKNLKEQFKILKTKKPIIVCIGKNTYNEYVRFKKDLPVFSNLFFIKNPNGYRKKGREINL